MAIATPLKNGSFDEEKFRELVEWHIEQGTHGIVPCGTTGESPTLKPSEHVDVIRVCVEQVKKRVPILAGTGSNSTLEAIKMTQRAKELGADGTLQVTPYYNKPTQEGLIAHYRQIVKEAPLPLVVYNVPGRTAISVTVETMKRLAEIPEVVGMKEATGNMGFDAELLAALPDDFSLLSGDDGTSFPFMALGGKGVISVTANVVPKRMSQFVQAALDGKWEESRKIFYELLPLHEAMFFEANPIPVKAALALMGKMAPEIRSPLTPLSEKFMAPLKKALTDAGVI